MVSSKARSLSPGYFGPRESPRALSLFPFQSSREIQWLGSYYLLRFTDIPPRLAWRHVTNTVAMEDKLVPTNGGSQATSVELNEQ